MVHSYVELVDFRSGNVLASFPDECEALNWLRNTALEYGLAELEDLGLTQMRDGQPAFVIMDNDLVRLVAAQLDEAGSGDGEPNKNTMGRIAS